MGRFNKLDLVNQGRDREEPPERAGFKHLDTSGFKPRTDMEKIPGTKDRGLPDEHYNSLIDEYGYRYDNGYNFDEHESNFDPEAAKKAREDAIRKQSQN